MMRRSSPAGSATEALAASLLVDPAEIGFTAVHFHQENPPARMTKATAQTSFGIGGRDSGSEGSSGAASGSATGNRGTSGEGATASAAAGSSHRKPAR